MRRQSSSGSRMFSKYIALLVAGFVAVSAVELPEASQVALEAGRSLLPYKPLVSKIKYELFSIRRGYKAVSGITHQPAWVPGELLSSGVASPATIQRLNDSQYGPLEVRFIGELATVFRFSKPYNPEVLSKRLESEFGIISDPNSSLGRSQTITYNIYRKEYTFYQGSGDCPAGCIEKYYWVFREFSDGYIRLVRQSAGNPPDNLSVKYLPKPYPYAPSEGEEEEIQEGDKRFTVQGTGVLATKFKFQ